MTRYRETEREDQRTRSESDDERLERDHEQSEVSHEQEHMANHHNTVYKKTIIYKSRGEDLFSPRVSGNVIGNRNYLLSSIEDDVYRLKFLLQQKNFATERLTRYFYHNHYF